MRVTILSALFCWPLVSIPAGDSRQVEVPRCCGVTYTSKKCECPEEKISKCGCGSCKQGAECGCVATLKKGKGIIRGKVKHKYVRRYPAVVYVEEMPGLRFTPPSKPAVMDQKGKVFKPRVLPVLVGTTVKFANNDDFEHNVFSPDGEKYNLGNWKKGENRQYTFKRANAYVQLCSIHPEMVGYVVALKTPYFALAKKDGTFEIANVPPGEWKVKVWNERFRKKSLSKSFKVTVTPQKVSELSIKP